MIIRCEGPGIRKQFNCTCFIKIIIIVRAEDGRPTEWTKDDAAIVEQRSSRSYIRTVVLRGLCPTQLGKECRAWQGYYYLLSRGDNPTVDGGCGVVSSDMLAPR